MRSRFSDSLTPDANAWLDSVARHGDALRMAQVHVMVPADMIEEFTAFIEEPTEIADHADVWLRHNRKGN